MKLKIAPGKPILFFIHIKGPKGSREMRAVLDTGSQCSVISVQDARLLGYDAFLDRESFPGVGTVAVSQLQSIETDDIVLQEVSVGDLVAHDVRCLPYALNWVGGLDVILGLSFLQHFKTTIDYGTGYLTIEPLE